MHPCSSASSYVLILLYLVPVFCLEYRSFVVSVYFAFNYLFTFFAFFCGFFALLYSSFVFAYNVFCCGRDGLCGFAGDTIADCCAS